MAKPICSASRCGTWSRACDLHGFHRIHRSSLVSIKRIRTLTANDSGDYEAVLDDGTRLKVGRSYKDALFAALDPHT